MTDRTNERSQDQTGTARHPNTSIPPKPLVDLVARIDEITDRMDQYVVQPVDLRRALEIRTQQLREANARADKAEAEVAGLRSRVSLLEDALRETARALDPLADAVETLTPKDRP